MINARLVKSNFTPVLKVSPWLYDGCMISFYWYIRAILFKNTPVYLTDYTQCFINMECVENICLRICVTLGQHLIFSFTNTGLITKSLLQFQHFLRLFTCCCRSCRAELVIGCLQVHIITQHELSWVKGYTVCQSIFFFLIYFITHLRKRLFLNWDFYFWVVWHSRVGTQEFETV